MTALECSTATRCQITERLARFVIEPCPHSRALLFLLEELGNTLVATLRELATEGVFRSAKAPPAFDDLSHFSSARTSWLQTWRSQRAES